ncbi:MAG: quinone oxidoreductase [Gammaproteobacteria bacterium]|nr:quinone oxidoreductase [Gammaproteobacteria bacterium]MBV9620257.1 quinone oxidoreductase [Gammaproteobacteria bacterium]
MSRAIRFHKTGGPEVLTLEELEVGPPGPGEVQIRHTAIGLNYIDVYDRTGLYPVASLPSGLGREAAGVVSALGRGVRTLRVGERVAYVWPVPGAYCEVRNVPAERVVRVPRGIADEQAAALMLKGLTAHFLLRRTHRVARGETLLVHAAAGGVGLLLCQWARALGARVIGVVGSEAKAELARRHGCRHVLISGRDELAPSVRALTKGQGVRVVYDAVGKDTFMESLDCLQKLGLMVSYGNASGAPPAISPLELSRRGSLFLTRPTLFHYTGTRPELERAARELFAVVRAGKVKVLIGQRYPLAQAADAQRDLEGRRTTGATVLLP